ncbi:MAG: hypothetical protein EPN65_16580 [Pandoraea sp.]|uniref:hypothetical protein n=1 Tax=Pandoraea sp. TaxID=1883445 RepID=UPI001216079C|nr:hypothetical protein [Pandoraea sp.]TAM15929.1 MAG: hypothetical protein EPN65_16580 [Pandoraea sp.]
MNMKPPELEVGEGAVIRTKYPTTSREAVCCCYDKFAYLAPLFAAAPELLDALVQMVEQISEPLNAEHTLGAFVYGASIAEARAAIAKATGAA